MTLNDCTKSELLQMIEILKTYYPTDGDLYVNRALKIIRSQRSKKYLDDAHTLGKEADMWQKKATDLLKQYPGTSLADIPLDVAFKVREYFANADVAEFKSWKLGRKADAVWEES